MKQKMIIISIACGLACLTIFGEALQTLTAKGFISWQWYYGQLGDFACLACLTMAWGAFFHDVKLHLYACLLAFGGYSFLELLQLKGSDLLNLQPARFDPLDIVAYLLGASFGYALCRTIYNQKLIPPRSSTVCGFFI